VNIAKIVATNISKERAGIHMQLHFVRSCQARTRIYRLLQRMFMNIAMIVVIYASNENFTLETTDGNRIFCVRHHNFLKEKKIAKQ
jgi:hypothetical protein